MGAHPCHRPKDGDPSTVLVVGAGPIGLLAALIGVQHGAEVHVLDRATEGPKPALVKELGATYHTGAISDVGMSPDIVFECTDVVDLVRQGAEVCIPEWNSVPNGGRWLTGVEHVAGGGIGHAGGIEEPPPVRDRER